MNDNISKLYGALKSKGYTDIGKDEDAFRDWIGKEGNVKILYGALSKNGYEDIGNEAQFTEWVGVKPQQAMANLSRSSYQPTPEEVKQYTLQNKPDIFKPKTGSLVDRAAGIEAQEQPTFEVPNVLRGITTKETVEDLNNTVGNAYSTANQMGERMNARVDMLSKNLQDPEYLKSRNDVELRGLNSEIDDLLEKAVQEESTPVGGSAFMPAGARGRAYVEANKERVEDVTNLSSAKRLLEQSKYIADAARRGDTGVLSDTWQGFKDSLEVEDFTFGLADAASSAAILDAIKKVEKGETLTEAEDKLLRASAINMATQYYYANDLSRAYKAGQVSAESVPFMLEMAINPISSFGKASAKTLLNYGLKSFAKQVGKGLGKGIVSGTGMALTTGLGRVASGTTDRLSQGYNYGVDFDGNLFAEKKKDAMGVGEAFARSLASTAIENQSEMIFNAFKGMGGFMKGVQDVIPGGVNAFFNMLSHNKVADAYRWLKNSPVFRNYLVKDVRNATQIGGYIEERMEELYNDLANFAIGEMSWDELTDLDRNIDTSLGLIPTQVMFGILGLGGAASMRYQTRKTLEDLQATMNEQQRKELEGLLDMGIDAKEVDVRGFIRGVMENQNYTIENKRDLIKAAYYVAQQRSIDELTEADVIDKVNAENQFIDSMTDPSTGNYAELSRNVINPQTGESEQQKGYVVGWIGEGDKRQPIFVADGMENNYANRVVLKPTEWSMDSYREMPAEQVKAVNEEMNREEAAQQAEREAKYAPEVLNAQMQQGVPFDTPTSQIIPVSPLPEGNGWIVEEYTLDTNNKVAKTPIVRELTNDEYRDMLQAQIDAQEAAAPVNVPSGENVGEEVNAEVNAPVNNENVQPVAEVVASEAQAEQPKQPTLEEVVATLPKTKNNEIDYKAMTPQQQYQYTSLTESPEVAFEDLQADIAAGQEEIAKKQEKLSKARGGERAALRDEVRKLTQAQEELQAFYDSIAPKHEEVVNEESVEPIANTSEEAIDEPKVTEVRSEQPKVKKPKKKKSLFGQKKKDSEFTEEEMQPMNAIEFAASHLASGNIAITTESFKKETGYGEAERKKFMGMLRTPEKGGMTIEQAAEKLVSLDNEQNGHFFEGDTQAARDTIIELLGYETWGDVANLIKNNRTAERKKREEAEYAEYEAYLMEALHVTPEELELQKEYDEQNNPFPDVSEEEYFAKFAEKAEEYINYLNSYSNEQGRTDEVAGRNDSLLSEERAGDIGGNQRSESGRESKETGSESIHDSKTSQESTSGSEVVPSIEETNVSRMADIEAEILDIDGRKLEIEDELNELGDSDLLAKAALIDELSRLDELQAELQAEYSGLYNMNEESRAIIKEEGGTPLFRHKGKRTKADKKPFVERAKHWEEKTGVKIRIANNLRDVKNRSAFVQILRGSQVTGWFEESTGEVVLYMPHIASIEEVDTTFIHEVVAHKGLRGLLGERFNEFLDEVWNMMSKADQVKYLNYPGVNGDKRAAADEYIANTFETIDVTESAWSKLTELIKRFLKALGLEPKMTNADIANTIKKSYQRLLEGEGGASVVGEGTRFSAKKKASKTVLPEETSSFKGSVVSDADRAKVLNNLDNLQKVYEEKSSKRQKTFISDLSKALHLRNNGNNSNYADYVTVNGKEVTIRVSDHNVSVKDMEGAGKSNGISIVIGRKPNKGIREFGEAHIVEYYYNNKKLENSEGNPYSEIIQSFKQTVYSGEYKDTTGLAERQEVNESRFRVVFHGSGAEFDKFDHSFMGTGEGNQSFGWGTYVTDVKGIGENYGTIALRGKDMFEYIGDQSVNRWVLADAKQMMDRAGGYDEMIKLYGNATIAPGTATEQAVNFLKSTKKEDWKGQRHLYEVEIPEDNGSNYIAWDKMLPIEQAERIKDAIRNSSFFKSYEKDYGRLAEERLDAWTRTNGGRVYKLLGNIVWNEKDLSKILSEAGFAGFKYPTNYFAGGNEDATNNYVIFNEDDLKIVNHTRFRVAKDKNELVAVHNISEDNLRKVLNVGGLIMPSIAITKADMGHEGYGEISLLFEKETINPTDGRNKVYGGDAWTPRFPSTTAKINDKVSSKVYKKIRELIDDRSLKDLYSLSAELHADNIERTISDRGVEGYYDKEWMKLAYLLDNGKKVKIPMKMKDYGVMSEKILEMVKEKGLKASDIQDGGYKFYQDNADIVEAVKRIETENKLQSFPEEKRDALERLLNEKDMTYSRFDSLISSAIRMEYDLENGGLKKIIDKAALRESIEKKVKTNNADYNKWVDNLFDGIVEKYGIRNNRDWYTPSGNLRPWEQLYDNATPANILKHMLAENEQGGSGGFFDSNIMGASAETYESIEEIREKGKKRLRRLEDGEYDEWSNSISERMSEICNDFLSPSQRKEFGAAIDAKIDITNAVAKDKTADGIYKAMKRKYPDFKKEHSKKVEEIVKEIQDFAIGYFEAKPRRIVPLIEVRKAIVPKKTSEDILEGLKNNGIEIATYKNGDETARARLIKKESDGIRFRIVNKNQEIFVSNAQRAVEGIKQEKGTPQQWLAMIEKNGGLKAGEDKWLGLSDWLKGLDKITKDNYYISTKANFTKVDDADGRKDLFGIMKYLNEQGFEEHASPYRGSISRYWFDKETGDVYRMSDHWGEVASCTWNVDRESAPINGKSITIAKANLNDFKRKPITKAEILDFIGENKIRIKEVHYDEGLVGAYKDDFEDAFWTNYVDGTLQNFQIKDEELAYEWYKEQTGEELKTDENGQLTDRSYRKIEDYANETIVNKKTINSVRMDYTTSGLVNNHEIALTVPTIEPWNENDEIHFGDAGNGRAIAWIRFGETYVMEEDNFIREVTELKEPYRDVNGLDIYKTDSGSNNDFIAHGKGRNGEMIYVAFVNGSQIPVAHKTLDDAKGEMNKYFKGHPIKSSKRINVLVIDEIQSKRHQEGREKGYKPNPDIYLKENGIDVVESGEFYEFYKNGELDKRFAKSVLNNNINKAKDLYVGGQLKTNIPEAPFEKNWSELAFKRMLRYAAENGYDKVAWTTGTQQAERYSLSNVIDSISISKSRKEDGKYHVTSWDKETMPIGVASGNKTPEELKELFGKEIAQSLIEGVDNLEEGSDTFVLEGADLEVGGEGMKGFYDKMLPSFVNKYVKKWGTKVQDIELPNVEESGRIMHSVDVTDAMKESVMEGQTMFRISEKGKQIQAEVDKFTSKYNSKPVVVLDSSMTDDEIERMMEGYSAKEIIDRLEKKSKGGYSRLLDKIYIFAENNSLDEIEDTLFHENLHVMFGRSPLVGELYANVKAKNDKADEDLFEHYNSKDVSEELFVSLLAQAMVYGKLNNAAKYLSNESREQLLNTLKDFGYDNEFESERRRRSLSSRSADENQEGPEGTRTLPYSQNESGRGIKSESQSRERLGRLQQLFGRVADMGLDGVLGNKEYVNAMVDMYKVLPEAVQREVADEALSRYGGDVAPAVSDWLNHKADASVWDKVVAVIREALRKVGFDLDLNTNEAKYILWRSQKPLNRNNLLELAEDIDMKNRLKVGEYSTNDDGTTPDGGGTKFRESKEKIEGSSIIYKDFNAPHNKGTRLRVSGKLNVRDEYEATIKKGGFQAREAVQDAMLSLRRFQELIEKVSGKKIRDFENAWMHENRLSSVVQAQIHEMERKFYKPMMDAVKKLMAAANLEQERVADYLMLKHGIERNREMAVRKALTDSEGKIDRTRLEQWYQDKRNVRSRAATPHLDTWRKQQEELDNIALMYGADMSRDYSGLTSMFGTDDLADSTQQAYDEVEALETAHPAETEALGKAIKAMTQNTLDESFGSGLMDRKVYDELSKDMYDYYIPLRGFDETTSEEVYAYLDQDRGAFNAPLKRAKGRSSKSDNPIAYLKSIAESGIMQGERNKMKQSFLNLVINNPSDLVSVREGVWVIYNPASGEWEAAAPPAIPNNATPADVEAAMEAWETNMESLAASDPNVKKISEAADIPYRVIGNRMNQHQVIVKRLGKSYTLTINGNPRLAMALNGLTNPNNKSNDGKVAAYVSSKIDTLNRTLSAWYTTRNPDFVASNFMRDTFYTNTIVRAKEGNAYANKFHKNYGTVLPQMLILFSKYEKGTLNPADKTEAAFLDFMMNGGETGYSNLKDLEHIKKQISKALKESKWDKAVTAVGLKALRRENVEALAEKIDILNRAVENTARFAAFLTSREEGRSIAKSIFDAKEISVNFNKKGAGGAFFGMTGQTGFGNLAAMVGAGGRALYVFFNAAVQGTTNLMHVMKVNPKGTSAGLAAMFLMGAVVPFLFGGDDDDEKDYYDLPEHVRRNHLIIPGTGDDWVSFPLPIEYRIMYGMGELLTSWRTGHERGSDIARKMLNLTGQALPLNFLEEGLEAFVPSAVSPIYQVMTNSSWTGLPIYKENDDNKSDPEYTKAYSNVDRNLLKFTKALYEWTFDEENQEDGIDLNPAIIETLAKGYFGGLATQLSNLAKVCGMIAGEQEFDWRNIPIGNRILKTGDERTKEKRVTNEYFKNMEQLDFLQSRERMLKKAEKGVAVPEADKFKAQKDLEIMRGTEIYKKYQEFKKQKKVVDKIQRKINEKGLTPELEKQRMEAREAANKAVR